MWNNELQKLIDKKTAYHKWLATNNHEDQKQYARISREVKKTGDQSKKIWNGTQNMKKSISIMEEKSKRGLANAKKHQKGYKRKNKNQYD